MMKDGIRALMSEETERATIANMTQRACPEDLDENPKQIGSWQCQHCHLTAMFTWRGSPNPDDAPACCGGELMLPYRIPSQDALDVKVVSRWIDDIEREERESLIAEGNDPEFMRPI